MPATIRITGREATIDGYQWTSKDKTLEAMLNAMLDPNGAPGDDPDPDLTAAQAIVDQLGAALVSVTPDETPDDPRLVF